MSAQLAGDGAPRNVFSAHLALAAGVTVSVHAPTLSDLSSVIGKLQPTEAANDTPAPGKSKPAAATAPAGSNGTQTAASSAPAAAGAAAGDAGNATAAAAGAQTASSSAASESSAVTFDELKKAFLALSTKPGGREKCEAVLKPFGLVKLSNATVEQYPAVLAEIQKASA